ncbi:unnamed protein product [Peronospora belbahrii]|uniref:VWFA domain-containing protein n=1 Tax=Peronospora belbahrii TaxID=622444 RepID=A0AAU9LFY7_9STRA|nr:unnamed protein product [Peronospora belbahrii]
MESSPVPRLEELILSGIDVNVLNHTALSLWHFQQLMIELLPSAVTIELEEEDDEDGVKSPTMFPTERVPMLTRGIIRLGEGMNVAIVLYEQPVDTIMVKDDRKQSGNTLNGTQNESVVVPQGTVTSIKGHLTPDTRVAAIFHRYRCVLCLDASPSILSIDPSSGRLFLDLLYESVELFIWSILRPMEIGGKSFLPELHVSVLVQGALVESLCVLMQGYIVTQTNAAGFLRLIKERFQLIENNWASQAQKRGHAVFALNSLPTDCAPMIVLVTDGVLDARDVFSYDNLLMQLVRHDIQCNFLRIGGGGEDELNATFGFVPDTHLLRFVAEYTGGTVFDYAAIHEACYGTTSTSSNTVKKMTGLQDALFLRKSSVHANAAPVVKLNEMDSTSFDGRTLLPLRPYRMWRDTVHEYRIFADVNRIVEARLREGFSINKVHIKTYRQPRLMEKGSVQAGVDCPSSGDVSSTNAISNEVTKILIVFLLQWKPNVWLEYVVSTTTEDSTALASSVVPAPYSSRRVSGQGLKGSISSAAPKKPARFFYKDQKTAWSEWYVKMNILGCADFLRAFEDTMQRSSTNKDRGAPARGENSMASPVFVHDFIRNVQDVDRVLLHLMTATASINETSDSVANQFSFGINSTSASAIPRITSSHPVFNIIGDLSTVLWHRWFYVERFEILSVVKSDACTDLFYRGEMHDTVGRGSAGLQLRDLGNPYRMIHNHGANVYGTTNGHIAIGVESFAEPLVAILVKWSSQKLSQDLFLRFLRPVDLDKVHAPPRAKASAPSTASGGIAQRRRQRSYTSGIGECATRDDESSSKRESKAALCFVRLEFKNKTLCAVHVAFFATSASRRRQILNDLKSTIFTGINEVAVTPTPAKLLSSSLPETQVILCHRMLSRLLVTHDTLLLHGINQEPGLFNCYLASPTLDVEKENAGVIPPLSTCCGGSELQLHRVFGAYVWHSSWKWEVSNLAALLEAMRRLHDARISSGFWVLDWKVEEGDDGQGAHIESVIFGREILMENENGHTKTALVQYALRRVSDTCLMTSFWMEPQHGVIKTCLSDKADKHDKFHWRLKQAIGHNTPFESCETRDPHWNIAFQGTPGWASASSMGSLDDEHRSIQQEDVSIDWSGNSKYLGESELLHLIRGYLFKSDRHFLSCLYTFDCIINLRGNIESSKNVDGIVGSNWSMNRQLAAENGMILPPFSTARLLAASRRSTEHFLMYLQDSKSSANGMNESTFGLAPSVSLANDNLYSMLELTLRGLSDCEVSWTDYNGDVVTSPCMAANGNEDDRFFREGMDGQLPLWLKQHLAFTFKDRVPHHALSKGKCYAKLVSDDCVVLAFFPSLDTLQVQNKTGRDGLFQSNDEIESRSPFKARLNETTTAPGKYEGHTKRPSQQFSVRSADEDGTKSRVVRMSVSADDIVLYQERRRSFREGYKSWRMGHYQGSRDEKHSYGRDFQKLRLPSTPEDHEFCEEISRQAPYGCDFHLLIENANGAMGSGFFQVAFYECSLSRLSMDLHDTSNPMFDHADLPHTILRHLFFSKHHDKPKENRSTIPLGCGLWKASRARSPFDSTVNRLSSSSIRASHRFRKKIKRAHEHNFSRGVYMALREGGTVQHSDLLQALSSCIEVPVDVDITLLYRMTETAASHKILPLSPAAAAVVSAGMGADILKDKLTKSFETILSKVFVPIAGTKYYYFSGSENAVYEDLSASEYDLHILMEDSDDGKPIPESRKRKQSHLSDDASSTGEEIGSCSVGEGNNMTLRHCLGRGSQQDLQEGDDSVENSPHRSRRDSLGRGLPSPVITLTEERSENEQHNATVEEDAEFNKDVAVATSSFSVPFFFKFECRLLNSTRETRSSSVDMHALEVDSDLLRCSSSSVVREDRRKIIGVQAQFSSPSGWQKKYDVFLESLKTNHGSQYHLNSTNVSHIAESFLKIPLGRIALRLVTLTLPNEQVFEDGRVPPHVPFEMDVSSGQVCETNALPSALHNFSSLHLFQRQVLSRVCKDIKEWSSVEILAILKSANEITPAIGTLVQSLFDDLPELAVTKANYPLEFVAGSQETTVKPLDLFKREFEKGDLLNVFQCNGVYFVVETTIPTDTYVDKGIENLSIPSFKIPYWAFFELGADQITLQFHHPDHFGMSPTGLNRLEVLTRLQLGIRAVCRRVNQFLLLLQLHETRTCNCLLLPPNDSSPSSPRSPERRTDSQIALDVMNGKDRRIKQGGFFWPGQFECDLRYCAVFRLHERLAPNFALNVLCTSALEQFQVHNRRHVFVYRDRDGHVFYMKISIFYDTALSHEVGSQTAEERLERTVFSRSSTGGNSGAGATVPVATTTPAGVPGIRLEVFGVSEAGEEVTHELCRLLERKLDEATQLVLMKLLARNTKFQLSQSDLAFLCPHATEPSSKIHYTLPGDIADDCCTLLHYFSQTLKLAAYVRPVTSGGSLLPRSSRGSANSNTLRPVRLERLASAGNYVILSGEEPAKVTAQVMYGEAKLEEVKRTRAMQDSAHIHPACFGGYPKAFELQEESSSILYDATTRSPVFFFSECKAGGESVASGEAPPAVAPIYTAPEIVAYALYVLNLNPDLRLSPGFLSRVGKGLALLRVDIVRKNTAKTEFEDEYKEDGKLGSIARVRQMQDIPGLAALYSTCVNTCDTTLVARCQVWIRGSIHSAELSQVVEAFMDEALYDYHIEATIRKLRTWNGRLHTCTSSNGTPDLSGTQGNLLIDVDMLVSLFKSACLLPSSSVTNLDVDVSIAPWDLNNAVAQVWSFLCCLPRHLRPAVYAKSKLSGRYEIVSSQNESLNISSYSNGPPPDKFRMVVQHAGDPDVYEESSDSDAETTASMSSANHHIEPLMRTNSIHSETSDIDSVSGRVPFTLTSTGVCSDLNAISQTQIAPSVSSTTSSMVGQIGGLSHQPHLSKNVNFSERDVLLYVNKGITRHPNQKSHSHGNRQVTRSFYYVVDLSTSKGLRLYGYNMSRVLVEALSTHIARVLTWSMLREKLLRTLLLEKSGLSTAAPVGSMVLQPSSFFVTIGRMEQAGKGVNTNSGALCKDSAVHFIEYRPPVLSILQSNDWFPRVLDAGCLRSIEGTSLGVYLREAQTQPIVAALDSQYQRPRGQSSTNLGVSMAPPSIPDLTREVSGTLSQRSLNSCGDVSTNLLGGQVPGRNRSGGIISSSNVSDSTSSSPGKRLGGSSLALQYPGNNRSEATARMRGGAGAATALMAARARARGSGGFHNHAGSGSVIGAVQVGGSSSVVSSGDSVAPWDLPLSNMKGSRLQTSADEADAKLTTGRDGSQADSCARTDSSSTATTSAVSKSKLSGVNRLGRRGSRGNGLADLVSSSSSTSLSGLSAAKASANRRSGNETFSLDSNRIHSSWKKRLEFAWGPRFLFPYSADRRTTGSTAEESQHFTKLEDEEDEDQPKKSVTPLSFFCAALDKRWEAFETRSTSHTVCMNLLEKLASLQTGEEMEEPVAKDVVEHLVESGHLLLYQRFRAAYVERWIAAEVVGIPEEYGIVNSRLRALQSCMDLVHLLSYKREFVFNQDECSVAKLYTQHTVFSMGAGAGADILKMKQQVASNLEPLRLAVASEFYEEYAVHLRTLGFRRLRTLNTSRSCARAFPIDADMATKDTETPGLEGFTEYFYHPERAAAEAGGWKIDSTRSNNDAYPLSVVILEVKCDQCGVRLNAVLVSLHDLEQQDLRFQDRLAVKAGEPVIVTSGSRIQSVASWLRAQLQTEALIYGFTIRYFQQHILQWIDASHNFRDGQNGHGHSVEEHPSDDDALASALPLPWKKASTFQNIVKGLQCFLHAFPDPPDASMNPSAAVPTLSTVSENCDGKNTAKTRSSDPRVSSISPTSAAPDSDGYRMTSRAALRFSRRVVTHQHQHKPVSHLRTTSPAPDTNLKSAAPLSLLWHDCVIRVAAVTLRPTSSQSNCSKLILVQILLRYIACHSLRYEVLDLLQFGTPDAVVCHSSSGSFFHRPSSTNMTPTMQSRWVKPSGGYSLVITTQPLLTRKPIDKDSVQLLMLKSTPSTLGVGNDVLPVERAMQEAQLFTRELFRVAAQHYERDLLWSRLLFDSSRGPEVDVACTLALPADSFRVEVGPQQLEECLRLSICTPLETLDPRLDELLSVSGVCWQELALRLRDVYAHQLREFQFQEEDENSSHLLLLCPDAFDLIIHLTFITPKDHIASEQAQDREMINMRGDKSTDSPSRSSSIDGSQISSIGEQLTEVNFEKGDGGDVHVEICRREEPTNKQFTFAQRRSISEFVNSIVHWQWRSLIYD